MGGGDLLNLLIERDVFEEDFTRFYVAEVRPISDSFLTYQFILMPSFYRYESNTMPTTTLGCQRWYLPLSLVTNWASFIVTSNQTYVL